MLSNNDRASVDAFRRLMANVYELAAVSRRDSDGIARQKAVTVTQWHAMSVLSGNDATVPQIAGRLGVTRQAVQRVADQLLERGYVERARNPRHETSPLLQLTGVGRQVLQELWELSDGPRAVMLAEVDAAKLSEAAATLQDVLTAFGTAAERGSAATASRID